MDGGEGGQIRLISLVLDQQYPVVFYNTPVYDHHTLLLMVYVVQTSLFEYPI